MREEDKEERREGSHFGLEISAKGKGVGGEKWGKEGILETLTGHRCCWGAKKPRGFLELGSQRGCS